MAEEKAKAIEDSKNYFRLYEKCLTRANAAFDLIKLGGNNPNSDLVDEANKIKALLYSQHKKSNPNQIDQVKMELTQCISEEIQNIALQKDESFGINEYALPKIRKTLRKKKLSPLFHSYSSEDIRYEVNVEVQATGEDTKPLILQPTIEEDSTELKETKEKEEEVKESEEELKEENRDTVPLILTPTSPKKDDHPEELTIKIKRSTTNPDILSSLQFFNVCAPEASYTLPKVLKKLSSALPEITDRTNYLMPKQNRLKSMSITRLNSIDNQSREKMLIKEMLLIKSELSQKKSCIDELTEENLKLCGEVEELTSQLESYKCKSNKENGEESSQDEEYSPMHNDLAHIQGANYENGNSSTEKSSKKGIKKPSKQKIKASSKSIAGSIINDLVSQYQSHKKQFMKDQLPLKTVMKIITALYTNLIASNRKVLSKPNSIFALKSQLSSQLYDTLLNKYGNQSFAKKKLKSLIATCFANSTVPRIHLFKGFIGLSSDLEETDANFYLRCIGYMHHIKAGVNVHCNDFDRQYVPIIRAYEVCKLFFQSSLTKELYTELMKKIDKCKEADKAKVNVNGIIDEDSMMLVLIEQYHVLLGKIRDYVFDIFKASDLDGSNTIDFFEFNVIFKNIEPETYTFERCKTIFYNSCEYANDDKSSAPIITFNQFAVICQAQNIFSESSQNNYLGFSKSEEFIKLVEILKANYHDISVKIMQRIGELANYSKYVNKVLNTLKDSLNCITSPIDTKGVWMMYRFIERTSCDLYTDKLVEHILGKFNSISFDDELTTLKLLMIKESGQSLILLEEPPMQYM